MNTNECASSSNPHNNLGTITLGLQSVLELVKCPVCSNSMYPPIHQCRNGHTLCFECETHVQNQCPTCRQELGNIRSFALEKFVQLLQLPCRYASSGCLEMIPYSAKLQHEALCNFRHYNCPYAGVKCPVTGDIPLLVTHLRAGHNVEMCPSCTFKYRFMKPNPYAAENATWMLEVLHCFDRYFCLHFEAFQLGGTPVYIAFVRFMGDEADARNYSYSLEVGPNGNRRSWQGTPRSIRDSPRAVCDSQEGLMIERDMALSFSDGDGKELRLRVTGKIWSIEQNPEGEVFG